ncbi:MAG: serine hydrolase [Myxococcota bacterium]
MERLNKSFHGRIASFIIDPTLELRVGHDHEKPSYLASGVKLPFMVEVFRQEHAGHLSLDEELTYDADCVRDGAPRLNSKAFGTKLKIRELLDYMVRDSDNAASDMLAKRVGVKNVNIGLESLGFQGFTPLTTLLDVRRGIMRAVDVHTDDLSALDVRTVRWVVGWEAQAAKFCEILGKPPKAYSKNDLQAGFQRYYDTGVNSARLDSVASILEQIITRKLISPESSDMMLFYLSDVHTSRARIMGKLPPGTKVAHKTGSQYERICDLGIITLPDGHPLIVTACLAGGNDRNLAEATLAELAKDAYDAAVAAHKGHALVKP